MGNKVTDEQIGVVRSVVGGVFSDMDIIRALHLANNDATAAINIIFDTPPPLSPPSRASPGAGGGRNASRVRSTGACNRRFSSSPRNPNTTSAADTSTDAAFDPDAESSMSSPSAISVAPDPPDSECGDPSIVSPRSEPSSRVPAAASTSASEWWLLGTSDLAGLSTCKGMRLKVGEEVSFSFPPAKTSNSSSTAKFTGRRRSLTACSSEIGRFSTQECGEIGRIPNEWARCLFPLVTAKKVRIEGRCKTAPDILSLMDTVVLSASVYINITMFRKHQLTSMKAARSATEESAFRPLPALFRLLNLVPFKNASLTPEDLFTRKRPTVSKDSFQLLMPVPSEKLRRLANHGTKSDGQQMNDAEPDLENIVGNTDSSELEEMDPPNSLECELRPYQKQALYWMVNMEKGNCLEESATELHPCWDAYRLADKRELVVYLNKFSGEATTEFPSCLQMARGGILADAMGLGKTIMTISLLLSQSGKGEICTLSPNQAFDESDEISSKFDQSSLVLENSEKSANTSVLSRLMKPRVSLVGGCNLIVCPMTLLGQWKAEIETHTRSGFLTLYVHYGQSRPKDANILAQYDVVLTTYGVLASEFSAENKQDNGGLYCVQWFRVVLDEAHTIKSSKSQISLAASALNASRRWCLTGTPIQNNLEDLYSLLRYLKVEPWRSWNIWYKLVQKPYEEGDERGMKLAQSILKPIMLRRTKCSTDREGRPILVLPPVNSEIIYCELTEAEKDFYEALFKRSKVKFDQFVKQGRVLHNYASILELLLRLRQCCDHPFLVMSRGDTQDFTDMDKLAKHFLRGRSMTADELNSVPSRAYVAKVVGELLNGEKGECPICLEAFEDAVLTPCAHRLCRECLLTSWKSAVSGLCPVCRKTLTKHDLITAPTDSRFQIDIENNWIESSKVSALMKELEYFRSSGSKSIVFSQWTAFLDLLQIPLSRNKFAFVRLDGTLNQQQREKVINKFTEDSNILVLLMSLKAGGVGINLTAASNAFLLDPWWNPAVEEQAVMRIHRIGQDKSVNIRRFIVKWRKEWKLCRHGSRR